MPTIEEIIGFEAMLGLVEEIANGVPKVRLPEGLFTLTESMEANRGRFVTSKGTRQTSKVIRFGAKTEARERQDLGERQITLLHSGEHINHNQEVLMMLRDFDNPRRQDRGRQEVDRQTATFLKRFENLRIASVHSALSTGRINIDIDDNLIPTTSGAAITIDYLVPADHRDQLGGILGTSWADAGAPILEDMEAIQEKSAEDTGLVLEHAIYGKNLLTNLANNTSIKNLLSSDSALASAFGKLTIPNGFLEMTWWPASRAMYAQADGTLHKWFNPDAVVLIPEPTPDWYAMMEGSELIPTNLGNVSADAAGALDDLEEVQGMFSYAHTSNDPVGVKHLAGDNQLPVIKIPGATFILDTEF